jgi:exonuclease SbcC
VILRRVRLHPFGCFPDSELSFLPGLNVVLGPNEAGKSTVFRAIRFALFVPAKLRKTTFAEKVAPHLPAGGGDSIRTELEVAAAGGRWILRRRWGSSPSSELLLPGGGTISDEEAIAAEIAKLLPARAGTSANILMTEQSSLGETLDLLRDQRKGRESLADLSDILRRAVLSTGGVSVDRFTARIVEERAAAWSHWDRSAGGPEAGRGIERPWQKSVGTVLAAWYGMEETRAAWHRAVAHEAALDDVNAGLRSAARMRSEREAFIGATAAAAADARERRTVEAELRAARSEVDALMRSWMEWPVAENRARELGEAAAAAEALRAAMEKELAAAQRAEEARGLRERFERVQRRKAQLAEARARQGAAPRLEKKSLDEIRLAAAAVARLEAGVEAGMITVTVAGRAETEIVVQEDFRPEERRTLAPGKTARLNAGGRVRLMHRDMEIEVRSGDTGAEARAEKAGAARAAFKALLARHGVASPEDAEERARVFETLSADLRAAEKNLADELGNESLPALEARAAALVPMAETRPLASVSADLAAARTQDAARARELADLRRRITDWESRHGSPRALAAALGAANGRVSDCAARIERAAPLPAGFADAASFLKAFEEAQAAAGNAAAELRVLEERKRALEQAALRDNPTAQSAEELGTQATDAAETFQAELRRAEALDRIAARSAALLGPSDQTVYAGMSALLAQNLEAMTGGKHAGIVMEGPVPVGLTHAPGRAVSWDFLSAGTRDTLALALRLAMASYFLGDADGFMLLDDPLVDMDPERQRAAAATLKEFGASRQLVVFTCHPTAAELLGGNRILLDPLAS